MTCSRQDLVFIFYCLRRFCETIVRNGYQWICLVVSKCYLNLSSFFPLFFFFLRHVPHECYSLPSRVGLWGGLFLFFWGFFAPPLQKKKKSIWTFLLIFTFNALFSLPLINFLSWC